MGRTIPSFRLATSDEKIEWNAFNCLGKSTGSYLIECFQLNACIIQRVLMLRVL